MFSTHISSSGTWKPLKSSVKLFLVSHSVNLVVFLMMLKHFFLIIITPGRDFCVLSFKESVLAEFPKDQTHSGVLLWVCGCSHIFTRTVWVSWTSPQATGLRGPMASDQDLRGKPAVEPDAHQSAGAHQGAAAGLFFFFLLRNSSKRAVL